MDLRFPGGPVVKNLPVNAGNMASIPGPALAPHERLPEILVVPREKTPTGAAARGNP